MRPRHLDSLPSHDLVIWTDGSVFFLSGKSGSGVLANCSFCGPEVTFFHLVGSVCSSLSAEARAILQALCWSRQQQQVCHFSSLFLLSNCHLVLATLIYSPSFFLRQTLWQIWQELSSLSFFTIRLQWIPDQSFLTANEAADELTRRVVLVVLSAIFCSLSPLISSVHSFSRSGSALSHLNFLTHRSPRFPLRELVLPRCVLSRLPCNRHSFRSNSFLCRLGRIENPLYSTCCHPSQNISHLILQCPAADSL